MIDSFKVIREKVEYIDIDIGIHVNKLHMVNKAYERSLDFFSFFNAIRNKITAKNEEKGGVLRKENNV